MKNIKIDGELGAVLAALVGMFTLMLICIPISALVTMWCWNFLAPTFGIPTLTWIQAMVLQLLCSMLFKTSVHPSSKEK